MQVSDTDTDPDLTIESIKEVIDLTMDEEIAKSLQHQYQLQILHRQRQEELDFKLAASLNDSEVEITGYFPPKASSWTTLTDKFNRISKKSKCSHSSQGSPHMISLVGSSKSTTTPGKTPQSSHEKEFQDLNSGKWETLPAKFDAISRYSKEYTQFQESSTSQWPTNSLCNTINSQKMGQVVQSIPDISSQALDVDAELVLSDSTESDASLIISDWKKGSNPQEYITNENLGCRILPGKTSVTLKSSLMLNIDHLQENPKDFAKDMYINNVYENNTVKVAEEGVYERPFSNVEQKEALKNLLSNAVGADEITPKEKRLDTPAGLKITLLEHQKLGLEWMLKMENGSNKGGILADDMGLGKTIQSISIILQNPSNISKIRPTLIIAPTSLILQWKQEILDRVFEDKLRITMYYGANRIKDPKLFNNFDVILTSYGTVAGEWPKEPKKKKAKEVVVNPFSESDSGEDNRLLRHMAGPLFRATFYRIILDEAHSIKNKGTRTSKAVSELDAELRWCLTGTPIQNGISELYSLLRFLQIRPYNDWTEWRTRIEEPFKKGRQKLALKRIQTVMTAICLRRRKTDSLDGLPLVHLPPRNVQFDSFTFSKPEKDFYDALEKRIQLKFNSYVEAGTVMKNYTNILLLLLRLRQATCHPNLVVKDFEKSSTENADDGITLANKMDREIVERLVNNPDLESQECPICFDAIQNGVIIQRCGHIFCYECISSHISTLPNQTCPSCRGALEHCNLIQITTFYSVFAPEKYREKELETHSEESRSWKSSTKIDNLIRILHDTKANHPTDKTIVFSQFVSFLDLIEFPLKEQGLDFVRFDGSMNARERERAIETFRNNSRINILLISLKCGSLGLNLTCANRVCLMDVWWNPAIENQAIDRAHRFGQKKTVQVCRMTIKGTVEDRILALQEKKQQIADAVLDEGGRQSSSRLGLNDLMNLFNVNREDEDL